VSGCNRPRNLANTRFVLFHMRSTGVDVAEIASTPRATQNNLGIISLSWSQILSGSRSFSKLSQRGLYDVKNFHSSARAVL
jgi:hypothetical protein